MKLKQISPDIYEIPYVANLGMGIRFPTRTTIIELKNKLLIYSPGPFSNEEIEAIKDFNKHIVIIAPNLFHHFYFQKAANSFPNADLFAPGNLKMKNKKIKSDFQNHRNFESDELNIYFTEGAEKMEEMLIYHKKDKALVVCDLFFNMHSPLPFMTKLILTMAGAKDKFAQSRLVKLFVDDKNKFLKSTLLALENDIDLIIPSHGNTSSDVEMAKQILKQRYL